MGHVKVDCEAYEDRDQLSDCDRHTKRKNDKGNGRRKDRAVTTVHMVAGSHSFATYSAQRRIQIVVGMVSDHRRQGLENVFAIYKSPLG